MAATVSSRRQALADLARSRRAEGSTGRLIRRTAVGVILAALIGWIVLWLLGFFSTPKEVLAVRALVDGQVAELERVARNEAPLSYEGGSFGAMFETMRQVPEAYRDQARAEMGRLFAARERAEIDSFFAMPPAQRQAELDRRIQAEDARRRAWQAERASREASREGGPRGGDSQAAGTRGGPPPAAGPPSSGGRRRGDGTEDSRNMRRKSRLDRSTAESRARRTEYRRLKDQRRIELGIPPRR
jgi:hypothetical protein